MNAQNKKNDKGRHPEQRTLATAAQAEDEAAAKKSWLGRVSNAFSDALVTSRGDGSREEDDPMAAALPGPRPADTSVRPRPQHQAAPSMTPSASGIRRMIVPEGVVIGGSVHAANVETEIAGTIEGDVTVEGRLFLGATAVVTGNVRAVACRVDGLVEGKVECTSEIELAPTGRLNADVLAGRLLTVAGQLRGNVQTPVLRLVGEGRLDGDVMTRQLYIEEGATLNGRCTMKGAAK